MVATSRDPAICNLFAVAITRKTAPKREDSRISPRANISGSERMKVRPEDPNFHGAASIRGSTEIDTVAPDCHNKQGRLPLSSIYRAAPGPALGQQLQDTLSPSVQRPGLDKPSTKSTSAIPVSNQPLGGPTDDILGSFKALIRQLHIIRSSLNASKREYGKIKTYQHKALIVFCTGRCEGWTKEESKIERRISSVSRALKEDRKWEQQIVEKLEQLESILNEKGHRVDSWRQPIGVERWAPG